MASNHHNWIAFSWGEQPITGPTKRELVNNLPCESPDSVRKIGSGQYEAHCNGRTWFIYKDVNWHDRARIVRDEWAVPE